MNVNSSLYNESKTLLKGYLDQFDNLMELLKIAGARVFLITGIKDDDHGPRVNGGVGNTHEAMDIAVPKTLRRIPCRSGHELDSKGDEAVGEGDDRYSNDAKHVIHAGTCQRNGHLGIAIDSCFVIGVGDCHRREKGIVSR
ncbi:unnamed protein product [Ilex paraguariensis]|uniref:Uncharacterized protein n=1 Tax=Ilex paraguariensis TaxID=185542 RepID=A0ABC8R5K5_9AQUA